MDASKTMLAICAGILIICLFFCITALTTLRNTVDENETWRAEAQTLVEELNGCIESLKTQNGSSVSPPTSEPSLEVDATQDGYCLREVNGKIGAYTDDGLLIRTFDVSVATLPAAERELLRQGIRLDSWQEIGLLVQDYGG